MKRSILIWLALCILVLILLIVLFYSKAPIQENELDLGKVHIDSLSARNFLKSDSIKIRRLDTDYRPSGVLPILDLEPVSDRDCRDLLDRLMIRYSLEGKVFYMKDILAVQGHDVALWVNRASGAFKMTRIRESMSTQASINSKEALQIALDHVAREQLVQLSDSEELDVLFVSAVENAVTQKGEEASVDKFLSDHYVAFGRRYKGIPMVGSELILRLNGNGDVAMIKRVWRRIEQFGTAEVRVTETPLEQLIARSPEFQERFPDTTVSAEDIHVVSKRCGFLEAPADFHQRQLRPGCDVTFHIGNGRDEALSQILLPLETDISREQLLGRRFNGQAMEVLPPRAHDE